MTDTLAARSPSWKVRHSAWLLAVVLGVGSFSCLGFLYCAARVKTRRWWQIAGGVTVLSLVALVLVLAEPSVGGPVAAFLWLGLIALGVVVNPGYLRWRSDQTPLPAPGPVLRPALVPASREPHHRTLVAQEPQDEDEPDVPGVVVVDPWESDGFDSDDLDIEMENVDTWQEAEALAAWHMAKLGFDDAALTASGADGGIDVRASDAVAQVKHYQSPVGAPAVQQLRGAAHGHRLGLFYALSGYTKAALAYADDAGVALFTYDETGRVTPVNAAADLLQREAGAPDGFDVSTYEVKVMAQRVGQKLFDKAVEDFMAVAHRGLDIARKGDRSILGPLKVEETRIEQAIRRIAVGTVPIAVLLDVVEQIIASAERLRDEVARRS